jgi:hypothetical protein
MNIAGSLHEPLQLETIFHCYVALEWHSNCSVSVLNERDAQRIDAGHQHLLARANCGLAIGVWGSLETRVLREHEIGGSNPPAPTISQSQIPLLVAKSTGNGI